MLNLTKKEITIEIIAASDAEAIIVQKQLQEIVSNLKRTKVIGLLKLRKLLTDNFLVAGQINNASKEFTTKEYGGE